jgi:hypothetical protein
MDAMKGSTPAGLASGDYLEKVVEGSGTVSETVGVVYDV